MVAQALQTLLHEHEYSGLLPDEVKAALEAIMLNEPQAFIISQQDAEASRRFPEFVRFTEEVQTQVGGKYKKGTRTSVLHLYGVGPPHAYHAYYAACQSVTSWFWVDPSMYGGRQIPGLGNMMTGVKAMVTDVISLMREAGMCGRLFRALDMATEENLHFQPCCQSLSGSGVPTLATEVVGEGVKTLASLLHILLSKDYQPSAPPAEVKSLSVSLAGLSRCLTVCLPAAEETPQEAYMHDTSLPPSLDDSPPTQSASPSLPSPSSPSSPSSSSSTSSWPPAHSAAYAKDIFLATVKSLTVLAAVPGMDLSICDASLMRLANSNFVRAHTKALRKRGLGIAQFNQHTYVGALLSAMSQQRLPSAAVLFQSPQIQGFLAMFVSTAESAVGERPVKEGLLSTASVCNFVGCARSTGTGPADKGRRRLLRCVRCQAAWYCDRVCQRLAWGGKGGHRPVCKPAQG